MASPRVSLVVPNWNGRELLERNVPTWLAAAEQHGSAEVVVVDDASQDGSVNFLRERFGAALRVVARPENGGFGRAASHGVEEARGELVALLNSDVRPQPEFLSPLEDHFSDERLFSAAAWIADGGKGEGGRGVFLPSLRRGRIRYDHPKFAPAAEYLARTGGKPVVTLYGNGGNVMFRRDRFLALGGFDELYAPYYYEDADLGWCAWRRGWRSVVDPRSLVFHEHEGVIGTKLKKRSVKVTRVRNNYLCVWKNTFGRLWWTQALGQNLLRAPLRIFGIHRTAMVQAWAARHRVRAARRRDPELDTQALFAQIWREARGQLGDWVDLRSPSTDSV